MWRRDRWFLWLHRRSSHSVRPRRLRGRFALVVLSSDAGVIDRRRPLRQTAPSSSVSPSTSSSTTSVGRAVVLGVTRARDARVNKSSRPRGRAPVAIYADELLAAGARLQVDFGDGRRSEPLTVETATVLAVVDLAGDGRLSIFVATEGNTAVGGRARGARRLHAHVCDRRGEPVRVRLRRHRIGVRARVLPECGLSRTGTTVEVVQRDAEPVRSLDEPNPAGA